MKGRKLKLQAIMERQPSEGCSRHLGECILSYCATCKELLCAKCLMKAGHADHDVKNYVDYLRHRRKEIEDQLKRLSVVRQRVENQKRSLSKHRAEFEVFYEKTSSNLKLFEEVQAGMQDWRKKLTDDLERKKTQQHQSLDAALSNPQIQLEGLIIKLPKVSIHKKASVIIQRKVTELTPGSLLSLSVKEAYYTKRHSFSSRSSISGNSSVGNSSSSTSTYISSLSSELYTDFDDTESISSGIYSSNSGSNSVAAADEYQYIIPEHTDIRSQFQEMEQKTTTDYVNNEMLKIPPPLPPRNRTRSESYKQPRPLPRSRTSSTPQEPIFNSSVKNLDLINESQPADELYDTIDDTQPAEYDYIEVLPEVTKNDQDSNQDIYEDTLPHQEDHFKTMSLNNQLPVATKTDTEEFCDDTSFFKKDDPCIYEELDVEIDDTVIDSYCPSYIFTNSCFAESPGESVSLQGVCVNPLGCMIFSDPKNNCIRILMSTNETSKRITKRLKDGQQPQAITYDSSNQRIIFAADGGLNQVEFGDGKLKRLKVKPFMKGISPTSLSCTTATYKGQHVFIYSTILPKEKEGVIQCFDENGHFYKELVAPEVAKMPCGIDHMKGYLVIATLQDGCLTKITPNGQPLWSNEVDARKPGILQEPFGVVILPNEYIAVTESNAHRVSIFSSEGNLVLRFGGYGSEPGKFNTPRGIAVRLFDELVIVDSGNNRIQIFPLNSLRLSSLPKYEEAELDDPYETIYDV